MTVLSEISNAMQALVEKTASRVVSLNQAAATRPAVFSGAPA